MISLVALSLVALFAASPSQADAPKESSLVEEVEVALVQRTILAIDQDGNPVSDLEPSDIVIRDEGRRYDAAFLHRRDILPDNDPVTARVILNAPGGPKEPVEAHAREPAYFVILLDLINRPIIGRAELKEQVRRFIGEAFRPEELVSVISYSGQINMELPFTNDMSKLPKAIDTAYERKVPTSMDPGRRVRGLIRRIDLCRNDDPDVVEACVQQVTQGYQAEAHLAARRFLAFLQGGVRFASGLDGRKALIVVSQGGPVSADVETRAAIAAVFRTGVSGFSEQAEYFTMDKIAREANARDIALHFVSVPPSGSTDFSAASGTGPPATVDVQPLAIAYRSAAEGLTLLARKTGGRHVTTTSVDAGMTEVVDLERGGYTLGYYVDRQLKPGKTRRVKIRCTRPEVEIVTARSYAPPIPDGGEIELKVTLLPLVPAGDGLFRVPFRLQADPRQIGYKMKGGEAVANFTIETAVKRPGGRTLVKTFNFINHAYDKKLWKAAEIEPIVIEGFIEVREGEYELAVVLRNSKSGTSGRVTKPMRLVRR